MVVKITSLEGNGRLNCKFNSFKNRSGILLYCAGTDGITFGRKSRGDEKQLIDLEWPNVPAGHGHSRGLGSVILQLVPPKSGPPRLSVTPGRTCGPPGLSVAEHMLHNLS